MRFVAFYFWVVSTGDIGLGLGRVNLVCVATERSLLTTSTVQQVKKGRMYGCTFATFLMLLLWLAFRIAAPARVLAVRLPCTRSSLLYRLCAPPAPLYPPPGLRTFANLGPPSPLPTGSLFVPLSICVGLWQVAQRFTCEICGMY